MLKHNLLIIFRNFKRNKSSFFINLIGLSSGLACALLIYLWVNDELSVDKFHEKDSQLYQVMLNKQTSRGILTWERTPGLLAEALSEEMPEVEYATAVMSISSWSGSDGVLSNGHNHIKTNGQFAGKDYFQIFSYKLIEGDKNQVLADKNSIVLSEKLTKKLFKTNENVIGKTVEWNHERFSGTYQVSGVFENPPSNSTAQFDLLFNYELYLEIDPRMREWVNYGPNTYLILKKSINIDHFNDKIAGFIKSSIPESKTTLFVQQYSKKYLYDQYKNGAQTGGRIVYVRLFSIIALFILVIACINFMNLSTAKASRRMKEIGIKKAVGASRKELIIQYMGESLVITFLSLLVAILLVELLLPQFNEITGKNLVLNMNGNIMLSILGITLFTGLMAGSYPAVYLSGFNAVTVLKEKMNTSVSELLARKGLVLFQFTISVILIVSVLIVYKQIEFIQTKNLGYNRDNIISFKSEGRIRKTLDNFLAGLKNIPGVVNASHMYGNILGGFGSTTAISWEGQTSDEKISFPNQEVGYDFVETLGMEMKEGRSFSRDYGTEYSKIILNEEAVKMTGLKDPVGKFIKYHGQDRQIIGVVKDFHFESLYKNVGPCFLRFAPFGDNIIVKIKAGTEGHTLKRLEKFHKKYNKEFPFEFKFLDDDYQALYEAENRVAVLSRYFAGIAILISCLGLFGLTAFSVERRRKEIGIRKVLGSCVLRIVYLLSSDFTKIVSASMLISFPVSYFITKLWLDNFAYRIDLQVWYFVGAGLITLFITWITVGTQAIKAALANPVDSLRYE